MSAAKKKTFWIIGGIAAILVVLVVLRVWSNIRNSHKHEAVDNLMVVMGQAKLQAMPVTLTAVGQVVPEHAVQVRPQVSGMLKEVYFTEGQNVDAGQKLFLIDPAPFQAALASAKAAWENAKANADRLEPLAKQDFATPQEYENARATADQAEAAYKQAQINLSYTDIRAPIAGRTGSLAVKSGNIVAPTDVTPLVAVNQMQPIQVQFQLAQQFLPEVRDYDAKHSLKVSITREDGSGHLDQGKLVFIDNAVNTVTGTVMFKAGLPNKQEQLWPGQYVGVTLQLALQQDAVVVPQSAVLTGQQGNYVYVVTNGVAQPQNIKVDRQIGDLAVISAGLKGDEKIVTEVPRNLRPGLHVTGAPADDSKPEVNVPGEPQP
ncbi:MAG TPA: efflux RND transporter periplasmic adaptor subunit [Gammaproteobacteria bacterium]